MEITILQGFFQKISRENIICINFENDRLYILEQKSLDLLLEAYSELYLQKVDEKIYLFLDKVQVVDGRWFVTGNNFIFLEVPII